MKEQPLYRFVAYGDTRGRTADDRNFEVQTEIVNRAVAEKPALILQTGDLVFDGALPALWLEFDKTMQPVRNANIPYYPARGNHDGKGKRYTNYLGKWITKRWSINPGGNRLNYAVDRPPLRFISIDTERPVDKGSEQYNWIAGQLADAKALGLKSIPFFHVAIYSIGAHGPDLKRRAALQPLFERYRVPVAFQGHDHNYYRTYREGTVYVVSGGGGAPLYDLNSAKDPRMVHIDPLPEPAAAWEDVGAKTYHYCVADVFKDRMEVTVYPVKYARGADPIDRFTVPL